MENEVIDPWVDEEEEEEIEQKDLSKCRKWGLHDYHQELNNSIAVIDRCHKCGDKAVYYKRGGGYDSIKQNLTCRRVFLQPFGDTLREFKQEYGFQLAKAKRKEEYMPDNLTEKQQYIVEKAFKDGRQNKAVT